MRVWKLFGPYWMHRVRCGEDFPGLLWRGNTQEPEFPWRSGEAVIIRLPFTGHAIAFGKWVAYHVDENEEEPTMSMRPLPTWFD